MALLSVDGKRITHIPHEKEFSMWKTRLSEAAYNEIVAELHRRTEGKRIEVSSWIPGDNWNGTPFQSIYDALHDRGEAGKFFGLIVWAYFLSLEDDWIVYKPGEDSTITGTVYFQPS
jgi:hypothetical protein